MTQEKLLTQSEYARHRGCSGVAVHKAVKAGRISLTHGKIDPVSADAEWSANTRARAANRRPDQAAAPAPDGALPLPQPDDGYMLSRSRREAAEANMAEMKEAEMAGKFLNKSEVDAAVFEIARAMRDGLTNCARRIAAEVAALDKTEECEAVIDREHRALLQSMAHGIATKLGGSAAGTVAA